MQKFTKLNTNGYLYNEIPKMYDDIATALSNSSGNAFPTDNLQVGMTCYRTDQKKTYRLTKLENNTPTWTLEADSTMAPGKAEFDGDGNTITDEYVHKSGGTVSGPIKYSGSDMSDSATLTPKSYVDGVVKGAADQINSNIGSNNTAISNSISSLKTNGVNKLAQTVYINGNAFNGTQNVDIVPSQINKSSSPAGVTPNISAAPYLTATAIGRSNSSQYASVSPEKITLTMQAVTTAPVFTSKSGNLTLEQILNTLIQNCHSHTTTQKSVSAAVNCWGQCNCNCDCNCDCGDDGGGD